MAFDTENLFRGNSFLFNDADSIAMGRRESLPVRKRRLGSGGSGEGATRASTTTTSTTTSGVHSLPPRRRLDEMRAVAMSMPQLPMALSRESLGTGMKSECHCPACCTCRSLTNLEGSNGGDSGANKRRTCPLRRTLESDSERRRGRADTARTSTASTSSATSLIVGAKRGSLTESNVKYRMEKMLDWFDELEDQQRNVYLRKIIERCRCAQLHYLSVAMEGNLHRFCPHNCQDILSWLPPAISNQILSYLSPRDLCHSSQVSTSWNVMASHYHLWEMLCRQKEWQLSEKGEKRQIKEYSDGTGTVEWKSMFSERYRMRRNWLTGRYTVRTFEGHSQGISCVQFGESKIVSGSSDKTIKVWDIHTNKPWSALTLAGHSATVRCLQLHGDKRLVSGSADQTIKVWDLTNTGRDWSCAACRATMVGHLHTVRCLQVDDQKIVSGSYDKTLKVWNMTDGQCKLTLRGHDEAVLCLQYDASKMVSGSADKKIKIWDLERGRCLHTLSGHHEAVTCLHFDETRIISGSVDSDIKFWDLRTNKCVGTLDWIRSEGHTGVVRHLQADKWRIVSAADDKTLKVWSIETGQRLSTLRCHTDGVTCLQFNDWMMVSGSYDKTVKLYDFSVC